MTLIKWTEGAVMASDFYTGLTAVLLVLQDMQPVDLWPQHRESGPVGEQRVK